MRDKHTVRIDPAKCNGCSLCVKDCVTNNIVLEKKKVMFKSRNCLMCGHCVAICPQNAVCMTGFPEEPLLLGDNYVLDAEELLHAIASRRSIRHFKLQPVEKEKLVKIIEAGRYTPTASNSQGVSYLIIEKNNEQVEKKAVVFLRRIKKVVDLFTRRFRDREIDDQFFFKGAPAVIVVLSSNKVDGALAASNMELMAQAQGLGVLYSGFFTIVTNHSSSVRRELGLNKKEKAVTVLVIGYPAITYQRTAQKEQASVRIV